MYHDTLHICKVFFDIILYLMSDEVSLADSLFPIDKDMEFDNTVESALSHNTGIDIFDSLISCYGVPDGLFHIRIVDLIEEFADRWPTDMVDVVTHKSSCYECCPVSC